MAPRNLVTKNDVDVYVAVSTSPRVACKGFIDPVPVAWVKLGIQAVDKRIALRERVRESVQILKLPLPIQEDSVYSAILVDPVLFLVVQVLAGC